MLLFASWVIPAAGFVVVPRQWSPQGLARSTAAPVENTPFESVVEGIDIVLESRLERQVDGRGDAFLFKARCEAPGAAVLTCFEEIREKAKTNLAEPGYRPGDVPPWIKRQLVEFSLTSVMEDVVKLTIEAHGLEVLEGDKGEETIKWTENPADEARTFVLGSPFTFHAAFNATLPVAAVESGGAVTIDSLYKLKPQSHERAARVLAAGGKLPNLLKRGGGAGGKKSKKKPAKKRKR
ncbi:hypothetical protein CTAYLR_007904 [Chrysophaeum taylorii]|uniref:Uncharacterized protein n=1 Tax=Chrysophaeum taylorii TaxID=2483200 RepID=A0AAD7ULK5_9STRA|nr:hypothetical protein CTAYLR_007904 [Chrysophaeum taylorii]